MVFDFWISFIIGVYSFLDDISRSLVGLALHISSRSVAVFLGSEERGLAQSIFS
jgi:hypothetical protein